MKAMEGMNENQWINKPWVTFHENSLHWKQKPSRTFISKKQEPWGLRLLRMPGAHSSRDLTASNLSSIVNAFVSALVTNFHSVNSLSQPYLYPYIVLFLVYSFAE